MSLTPIPVDPFFLQFLPHVLASGHSGPIRVYLSEGEQTHHSRCHHHEILPRAHQNHVDGELLQGMGLQVFLLVCAIPPISSQDPVLIDEISLLTGTPGVPLVILVVIDCRCPEGFSTRSGW